MSEKENVAAGEKQYPRLEKFVTNLGWLFTSLLLVGGGNYLWYKVYAGYGPDTALIGAVLGLVLVVGFTIWAAVVTKSGDVAREGFMVVLVAFIMSFLIAYLGGVVVYGRYEGASDMAQYAKKFTDEHCAFQGCTKPDDAGVVEIDALQAVVDEQDAVKKVRINLESLNKEALDLDEKVIGAERKAAVTKSLQGVEDALKGRERDDYWLLRSVINFSSLVCQTGNQPAVGAQAPGGVVAATPAKTSLVCRPQVMLDYGKGLPETYPLWTWILEKVGLLPVRVG